MIKINLCPIDELESQYWYLPDVLVALVVAVAGYFGVQYYLGTLQVEIDAATEKISSLEHSTRQLEPDIKRFEILDTDIRTLNLKLVALQSITVSKISRYKPVIALEHLQNLRPAGVWYSSLRLGSEKDQNTFELKGQAFDNILTAELLTALRSTASGEAEPGDLRTQVYFDRIELGETVTGNADISGFPELASYPQFSISGVVVERAAPVGQKEEAGAPPPKVSGVGRDPKAG